MKLLIDSTQIPLARTGVGIYADQLIEKLAYVLQPADEMFVLIQDDDLHIRQLVAGRQGWFPLLVSSSIFRNRLMLALYEQCVLPWLLRKHKIDLVHSLHYTFPLLCPCARAVTIHDLTYFVWPQMHTAARRVIMSWFTKMALRHAEGALFVSEATRDDAERLFGAGSNLRAVTPLAVDREAFADIQPERIAETLSRLEVRTPYILFLGTLEPRKNVVRLIQAFDSLSPQHSQYSLVIAGKTGWHYDSILEAIEKSPCKERIHRIGYVASGDKPALIAGCELLVYPSLYEGFGLPVLEGMAAGVPVITSNVSSLPEVAGTAAVLVDPGSVDAIAEAMDLVLSERNYRAELQRAGKEQACKFSWETTARLTYAAYLEIGQSAEI